MRVIAGKFRSRTLRSLKGQMLRPTSDRLRETLFNILGAAVGAAPHSWISTQARERWASKRSAGERGT